MLSELNVEEEMEQGGRIPKLNFCPFNVRVAFPGNSGARRLPQMDSRCFLILLLSRAFVTQS